MPTQVGGHTIFGAIEQEWLAVDGAHHFGPPLNNETPTFDGTGRYQSFAGGLEISWHPETGAHAVYGGIAARWLAIGRERYGFPITDESGTPDGIGRFNHFRAVHLAGKPEASIYWTPQTGAQEVYGGIRARWSELGWEKGPLRYPVAPEHDQIGHGRVQRFQGGVMSWTPEAGTVQRLIGGDFTRFDTGYVPSDLAMGGSMQLTVHRNGDYQLQLHVHDSGGTNIAYGFTAVLVGADGQPFSFSHAGHLEGLTGALFTHPKRDDDWPASGNDQRLAASFDQLVETGSFIGRLTGQDKLLQSVQGLLEDALKSLAAAGIKAAIALI